MKISIIGGGAWGATLAQVLNDNHHDCLIYDVIKDTVDKINSHVHPVFNEQIDPSIKATNDLHECLNHSNYLLLVIGTKFIRDELKKINNLTKNKLVIINASKGIEPHTFKRVSQIVTEEIDQNKLKGFVVLTGPSHAEDVIKRKMTLLISASTSNDLAQEVQLLFSNSSYMRVYTSTDVIGCELGGATKNAIAVVSGILTGLDLGENARAALITRGIVEIVRVIKAVGGKETTAFGLAGIGDLIVTASSENSRNFQAGKLLAKGLSLEDIYNESKQTIEGIRSIEALHDLSTALNIELPIINGAYDVIFNKKDAINVIKELINRKLKPEALEE